eukprot:6492147-Amphidinium_carterae.3
MPARRSSFPQLRFVYFCMHKKPPCEEAVGRLQSAMANSRSNGILVQVGVAVEGNAFWKHLVEEYVATSPAVISYGPLALQHVASLTDLQKTLDSIHVLKTIVLDLGNLKASLRPGSTDELMEKFLACLRSIWDIFQKEGNKLVDEDNDNIAVMWEVLSEASNLYGYDASLKTMVAECSQLKQHKGKASILKTISVKVQKLLDMTSKTSSDMIAENLADMKALTQFLRGVSLPNECFTEDKGTKGCLEAAFQKILTLGGTGLADTAKLQENLKDFLEVAIELAAKVGKAADVPLQCFKQSLMMLETLFSYIEAQNADKSLEGGAVLLDRLVALQRAIMQAKASKDASMSCPESFQDACKTAYDHCFKECETMRTLMINNGKDTLDVCYKALKDFVQPMPETFWLQQFKGKTFEEFVAHTKEAVMKLDAAKLVETTQNLQQACGSKLFCCV